MKRFSIALASSLFFLAAASVATAEMTTIYGPVYVAKTKAKDEHHRKEAKLSFSAPVPGKGVIVVKNGGDSGKKARVASAEIELNGIEIADRKDFNKNEEVLNIEVDLLAQNDMEVEVKSCKECELEIVVMGEMPVAPPPRVEPAPLRAPVVDSAPVVEPAPVPLRAPLL